MLNNETDTICVGTTIIFHVLFIIWQRSLTYLLFLQENKTRLNNET